MQWQRRLETLPVDRADYLHEGRDGAVLVERRKGPNEIGLLRAGAQAPAGDWGVHGLDLMRQIVRKGLDWGERRN